MGDKQMSIIAVINHFSDTNEFLQEHCEMLRACGVNHIICTTQQISNAGHTDLSGEQLARELYHKQVIDSISVYEPIKGKSASWNELNKRKIGLELAKKFGLGKYDYYINTDTDEFYKPDEFKMAYDYLKSVKKNVGGLCFPLYTYYKRRTLRTENLDNYFVSGLFELNNLLTLDGKLPMLCDPTRQYNFSNQLKVEVFEYCPMHHYSWVRQDIAKKIENSSAKHNIVKYKFYNQYLYLKEGSVVNGNKLIEVEDISLIY